MLLPLALLMQSAAVPPAAVAVDRPRLAYRFDDETPRPTADRLRTDVRIDWRSLDASLAGAAERERSRAGPDGRVSLWRGVPVVVVDGQRHGLW